MKSKLNFKRIRPIFFVLNCFMVLGLLQNIPQVKAQQTDTSQFFEYKGVVLNSKSNKPLEFASVVVNNSNISTISNIDGEFLLKVPKDLLSNSVTITYLGFKNRIIAFKDFTSERMKIKMEESFEKLPDVNLVSKDAYWIIKKVMGNRQKNYFDYPIIMKAFYRESIKKRRTYASLSESVVDIYKQPYKSSVRDYVKLNKARKSTDYRKIDTLIIKLQGGPYNNLNMDMIKNENLLFTDDIFEIYDFSFDKVISLNNNPVSVIDFVQKSSIVEPFYRGKLYIDSQNFALVKAVFSLNLENLKRASKYFVKKKPPNADVIPTRTQYIIDYRIRNGKWYYGYSRIELSFKIDWNKKLFNSLYHIIIEMAITDWEQNIQNLSLKRNERLKRNVILNERASGFSNPEFWGEFNVIEPDKSIDNAIKKIQKNLNRK